MYMILLTIEIAILTIVVFVFVLDLTCSLSCPTVTNEIHGMQTILPIFYTETNQNEEFESSDL